MATSNPQGRNSVQPVDGTGRASDRIQQIDRMRAVYESLPERDIGKKGSKLDLQTTRPDLVAQAAPATQPPYFEIRVGEVVTKAGDTVNPLGTFGQLLERAAPFTEGAGVEVLGDQTSRVFVPNTEAGGRLVGAAASIAMYKLGIPEGASPAFLKGMRDAQLQEGVAAGYQLFQGLLDVGDIYGTRIAARIGRYSMEAPTRDGQIPDKVAGAPLDPAGSNVGSPRSRSGRVAPEVGNQLAGKPAPGLRNAEYVYDAKEGRLGIRNENGASYWFQDIGGRTLVTSRMSATQRKQLETSLRASPGDANAPLRFRTERETKVQQDAETRLNQQREAVVKLFDPRQQRQGGSLTLDQVPLLDPRTSPPPAGKPVAADPGQMLRRVSPTIAIAGSTTPSAAAVETHNRSAVAAGAEQGFVYSLPGKGGTPGFVDTNGGKGFTPSELSDRLNRARSAGMVAPDALKDVVSRNGLEAVIGVNKAGQAVPKPKLVAPEPRLSPTAVRVAPGVANVPAAATIAADNRTRLANGENALSLRIPTRNGVLVDTGGGNGISVSNAAQTIEGVFDRRQVAPGLSREQVIAANGLETVLTVDKGQVREKYLNELFLQPGKLGDRLYGESLSTLSGNGITVSPTASAANRDQLVSQSAASNAQAIKDLKFDALTLVGIGPQDRGFAVTNRPISPAEVATILNRAKQLGFVTDAQGVLNRNGLSPILTVDQNGVRQKTMREVAGSADAIGEAAYQSLVRSSSGDGLVLQATEGREARDHLLKLSAQNNRDAIARGARDQLTLVGLGPQDRGFMLAEQRTDAAGIARIINKAVDNGLLPDARAIVEQNGLSGVLDIAADGRSVRSAEPPENIPQASGQPNVTPTRGTPTENTVSPEPATDDAGGGNRLPPNPPIAAAAPPPDGDDNPRPTGNNGDEVPGSSAVTPTSPDATSPGDNSRFQIRFRQEDRAKVDAYFRQATGMSLDELQGGSRGEPGQSAVDRIINSNLDTRVRPGTPIVIEDNFHGRKGTIRIDPDGKMALNLDTGIKVTENVIGVPRIDERVLSEDVFKNPQLREEMVHLYISKPMIPGAVAGVPAPIGAVNLQTLVTIPAGRSKDDLRGLVNSVKLINDIRKSRENLINNGAYLQDIKPVRLALSLAAQTTDARIAADGFMPINVADALLPRLKNEQRVYVPNTVKAIDVERGLTITKDGKISVNADRQPDGTYRLKEGTQLTLNLRDANDAQMPYITQWLIGGAAAALGDPSGGVLTTTAAQTALSFLKQSKDLSAVHSTGHFITLKPGDILPAPFVDALNQGFNQPNVFRSLEAPALGVVAHKYAKDRPFLFVRLDPGSDKPIGGFNIPKLKPDGTVAQPGEQGTSSLREFWGADGYPLTNGQDADLQARLNAALRLDADGKPATPQLGTREPDNEAKIYRLFPLTMLHLSTKTGGIAQLDGQKRLQALVNPTSSGAARLDRPEFRDAPPLDQQDWFVQDSRELAENLRTGRQSNRPDQPRLTGVDPGTVTQMQSVLGDLPPDSAVFGINHIDFTAGERAAAGEARNPIGARLEDGRAALFEGEAVSQTGRDQVRTYLDQLTGALPADRRAKFQPIVDAVMSGLVVGQAATAGTLEKLDAVRLTLEAASPQSPDRLDAARSLTERLVATQLNEQRRAEWTQVLSQSYRDRVPNWERAITSVTGGVLPPLEGDYGHSILSSLQRDGGGNLNGFHVRVPSDALIPRSPTDVPDRPYVDFMLKNQDDFIQLLDQRVKGSRRQEVLESSGLAGQTYVGPRTEDYKFNFSSPQVSQRFGPTPEQLNPYALAPTPGVTQVDSPAPIQIDGRRLEIVEVDPATNELVLAPEGSQDRFISQHDLLPHTLKSNFLTREPRRDVPGQLLEYEGNRYRLQKVETQSDANGFTLRPVDADGAPVQGGKDVFVPQFKLPEITMSEDGKTYRPVGTSWTQVQFQPDVTPERVKLTPGMTFEAFLDDPARGARASGGAVTVQVQENGQLRVTASNNASIPVGNAFDASKIVPTITSKRSQHTTGEHLADLRGVMPIGSPIKVRTADILTSNNRASPPAGTIGVNAPLALDYVRGQKAFDSVAGFINDYKDKVPPKALILQNVVYELVSKPDRSTGFKSATPILEALKKFRERYPDTPIILYSSNERIALKLPNKINTMAEMQQHFDHIGAQFRSRTPKDIPQTTHAKSVNIVAGDGGRDAALVTTSGFEPRPRGKSDFNIALNRDDAALLNLYTQVATQSNEVANIEERARLIDRLRELRGVNMSIMSVGSENDFKPVRSQLAAELAERGVLVQDPSVGQSYIQAGYKQLITGSDPDDRVIIAQIRELRMPSFTQMLIDQARQGKHVLIQTSVFDAESYRLLEEAKQSLPNLRVEKIGGAGEPADYAHYNAIITSKGMVIASAYPWSSMMDAKSEQPSSELGVRIAQSSQAYRDALASIRDYQQAVRSTQFLEAYDRLVGDNRSRGGRAQP